MPDLEISNSRPAVLGLPLNATSPLFRRRHCSRNQIIPQTGLWKKVKQLEDEAQGGALGTVKKVLQAKLGSQVGTKEQPKQLPEGRTEVTHCDELRTPKSPRGSQGGGGAGGCPQAQNEREWEMGVSSSFRETGGFFNTVQNNHLNNAFKSHSPFRSFLVLFHSHGFLQLSISMPSLSLYQCISQRLLFWGTFHPVATGQGLGQSQSVF